MWIAYDSYWSYWPFQRRSTCKMAQGSTDYQLWLYHAFCLETQLGNRWVPSTFQTAQTGNQQRSWGDAQQQEHLGDDLYVTWPKKITELGMMCCRFCFNFFSDFLLLKSHLWTWHFEGVDLISDEPMMASVHFCILSIAKEAASVRGMERGIEAGSCHSVVGKMLVAPSWSNIPKHSFFLFAEEVNCMISGENLVSNSQGLQRQKLAASKIFA